MISMPFDLAQDDNNPLDMIEDFLASKGWHFDRISDEHLYCNVPGRNDVEFLVQLHWQNEFSALEFRCAIELNIQEQYNAVAADLLMKINENMWLGHFDILANIQQPMFRHTLMLQSIPCGIATEMVESLINVSVNECDRFYPTFQLLSEGDVRTQESLEAAMLKTVGEA